MKKTIRKILIILIVGGCGCHNTSQEDSANDSTYTPGENVPIIIDTTYDTIYMDTNIKRDTIYVDSSSNH